MANYSPPIKINQTFNTQDFQATNSLYITKSIADLSYLRKTCADISNAITLFYNQITFNNFATIFNNGITGTLMTASQPNITSIGTVSTLVSSGNIYTHTLSVVNGRSTPFSLDNNGNVTCASVDAGSGIIQTYGPISCHNITSIGSIFTNNGTSNTAELNSNGDLNCNTINSFVASNLVDLSTAQNLTNKTFQMG